MKFRHKNGGICEVETAEAIDKLKKNSEYEVIKESKSAVKELKSSERKG